MKRRNSQRNLKSVQQDGSRKKRSKRSADNQSQEVDQSPPPRLKPEPPPLLDPLQMYNISRQILSYLNVEELKVARQVCSVWSQEGGKMLLAKSYLRPALVLKPPKGSKKQRKDLKRFLTVPGSPKYLKMIFHPSDEIKYVTYLLDRVPVLRKGVFELKFEGSKQEVQLKGLSELIRKLPRLKVLKTKTLNLSSRAHWWLNKDCSGSSSGDSSDSELENEFNFYHEKKQEEEQVPDENSQPQQEEDDQVQEQGQVVKKKSYLDCILNKLEKLKEIQLDFKIRMDNFAQYKNNCKKFKGITHVSLAGPRRGEIRRPDLVFLSSPKENPWNITHLTFSLSGVFDKVLVRKFLLRISGTLKYFDVFLCGSLTDAQPWLNDWYIPEELNALETLKLRGYDKQMISCLAIALQFPKLKKLQMPNPPTKFKAGISSWKTSPLSNDRKLQSNTIEEVDLGENISNGRNAFINCSLWPKVKYLKIGTISKSVMKTKLIQNWKNLEGLELDFSSVTGGDLNKMEQWMCGRVSRAIYNETDSGSEGEEDDDEETEKQYSSFKSLTNLKSLTVNNPRIFTDHIINNCLRRMKLQTICFRDCMISKAAMDKLKKELSSTAILMLS